MTQAWYLQAPQMVPPLDPDFRPAVLAQRKFRAAVEASGQREPLAIALESADGAISRFQTTVFNQQDQRFDSNLALVERIIKFLLWQRGGWRLVIGGPSAVGEHIRSVYAADGARAFDVKLMSEVYGRPFQVEVCAYDQVPAERLLVKALGRHLDGCRIGFDLGASDRKVSAVQDGQAVFSEEVVWHPREQADPQYHYDEIMAALKKAAAHLPRVDAIGGSAAGIYVNNSVRVASLFRGVSRDLFDKRVRGLFKELQQAWNNIPFEVINDGEVTALAGSMSLGVNRILGIAMGSSLAGGYVDGGGNVMGWLDELAFAPVDYQVQAAQDEWSGDRGVGASYFSQMAVNRLAAQAGLKLDEGKTLAERLKDVQELMAAGDRRAQAIFETIGIYLGYALAHYVEFYAMDHLLLLGRVMSGKGGDTIIAQAQAVLQREFPELAQKLKLAVPDEASRRVGQSIAAASLPEISR